MSIQDYDLLWNFSTQENNVLLKADDITESQAFAYVPQTPRAQKLYQDTRRTLKTTPYEAIQLVNAIIFGHEGIVNNGETQDNTRH